MGPLLAKVKSNSDPGKEYEIRQGKDGVTYCSCWGWKRNKDCKHLRGFFAHLESLKPGTAKPITPKSELEVTVSQAVQEALQILKS